MVILSMYGSSASGAYNRVGSVNDMCSPLLSSDAGPRCAAPVFSPYFFSSAVRFNRMSEPEHGGFVEMPGQNLHPHRQTLGSGPARHTHTGNARQAAGNGVN